MYVFATPMCVWRRHATRHRRCKGVKVVGRRASPRRRKNYANTWKDAKQTLHFDADIKNINL